MNLRLAVTSLSLTVALAAINNLEAFAQTVRTVSLEQAQGREAEPVTIPLAAGTGVNISFISTNATIVHAWLDNPSWLTLDSDGCLVSAAMAQTQREQGRSSGQRAREVTCSAPSYVLHLRRINDLKFPGLPTTNHTTLSVITRNQDGARQISVFRLVRGNSTFHTVEVVPSQQPAPSISIDLASIQRGREVAIRQNLLRSGDPLDSKILNFINLLGTGTPSNTAMTRSGVSLQLVNKLTELGRNSLPTADPRREIPVSPTPTLTPPTTPYIDVNSVARD